MPRENLLSRFAGILYGEVAKTELTASPRDRVAITVLNTANATTGALLTAMQYPENSTLPVIGALMGFLFSLLLIRIYSSTRFN